MYKNQLQELAQRSCFNLPSYACMREGPDHAPRFKATVNFNGEMFESPSYFSTLRQAEHAAAEVALNTLAKRGPSKTLASKVLDETGVYKNLLQETAHRAGLNLPVYTTVRSGPRHVTAFSCTVDLAGMSFTGEPLKTKKQAQKSAAMSAWSALKQMSQRSTQCTVSADSGCQEEQEQAVVARFLATLKPAESNNSTKSSRQKGHLKSSTSVKTFSRSFSSFPNSLNGHNQNWASPTLSLDMVNHHMWLLEQQRHLLPLGVPISSGIPPRQVMPLMQLMMQPNHLPYCFTGEEQPFSVRPGTSFQTASSSLYFSNQPVRDAIKAASIELHEVKTDHNSNLCQLQGNKSPIMMDENLIRGKQDSLLQTEKLTSAPLEVQDEGLLEVAPSTCASSEIQPVETKIHNPPNVESISPNIMFSHVPMSSYHGNAGLASPTASQAGSSQRYRRPPLTAPRMQRGVRPYIMRPTLGRMQTAHFHGPFMPPAVQIRSVVPVCSAPPPSRMPSSNQERSLSHNQRSTTTGDVRIMNSSMENLHI